MAYPRFCRPMGLQTARNFRSVAPPFEVSYFTTLCDTLAACAGIDLPMTAAAPIRFARRRLDRAQTRRNVFCLRLSSQRFGQTETASLQIAEIRRDGLN